MLFCDVICSIIKRDIFKKVPQSFYFRISNNLLLLPFLNFVQSPMDKFLFLAIAVAVLIQLVTYGIYFKPNVDSVSLSKIFRNTEKIIESRYNDTQTYLNRAKVKGASNSYVEPVYLNDHEGFLTENVQLENATILVLCRNWELTDILSSMRSLEDRFNKNYHYPWTFLNDEPFTDEFKEWTTEMASGKTEYGLIPVEDWNTPDFIDLERYDANIEKAIEDEVLYGYSKSYRNMCHFNSGFFFRQELTMKYDYYFRVEPGVQYFCDFQMDPFRFMRENKKKYSFIVTLYEYPNTIPTLWQTVEDFLNEYPGYLHLNNSIEFITDKSPSGKYHLDLGEDVYNMCHFWSNFEIGDLNFFRSQPYMDYFNYLSKAGGFYYERWGDAPVHSIAASILLDKNEVHHFDDIGYTHIPFFTFPDANQILKYKRCVVPKDAENMEVQASSCLPRWWKFGAGKKFLKENYHEDEYMLFKRKVVDKQT